MNAHTVGLLVGMGKQADDYSAIVKGLMRTPSALKRLGNPTTADELRQLLYPWTPTQQRQTSDTGKYLFRGTKGNSHKAVSYETTSGQVHRVRRGLSWWATRPQDAARYGDSVFVLPRTNVSRNYLVTRGDRHPLSTRRKQPGMAGADGKNILARLRDNTAPGGEVVLRARDVPATTETLRHIGDGIYEVPSTGHRVGTAHAPYSSLFSGRASTKLPFDVDRVNSMDTELLTRISDHLVDRMRPENGYIMRGSISTPHIYDTIRRKNSFGVLE